MPKEVAKTIGKRAPDGAWEIPIVGDIGYFGTSGEDLIRELRAVKPSVVKFIIYSPGGAVYDAIAVAGYLREQGVQCFAEIYGLCASAATVFAALAGPKNTAIAPGSMFLVHMPFGGDQKAIDNAVDFLVDLYVDAYGWTKGEAKKHMQAEEGEGILWTADEAKKLGVVSEIMEGAKVAANMRQRGATKNENEPIMSDKKTTVTVNVSLTLAQALAAVASKDGVPVEVDATEAASAEISKLQGDLEAANARIAELETERDAKAVQATEAGTKVTNAEGEVTASKELLATAQKRISELEAELAKPLAKPIVGDNKSAAVGAAPSTSEMSASDRGAKAFAANMNTLERELASDKAKKA